MFLAKSKSKRIFIDYRIPEYIDADYVVETYTGVWALFNVSPTNDGRYDADVFFSEFKGEEGYQKEIKMFADDMPSDLWSFIHDKINQEIEQFIDLDRKESYTSAWLDGFKSSLNNF